MFTLDIKAFQKRWAEIISGGITLFKARTTINSVEVSDPGGQQGTVGVQKEMFLSKFAGYPSLQFVNGVLVPLKEASVKPHRMLYTEILSSSPGEQVLKFSDNYNRADITSGYSPPFTLEITFGTGDTYDWVYTDAAQTLYGTTDYSADPVTLIGAASPGATEYDVSTNLMAVVPGKPDGVSTWESSDVSPSPFGLSSVVEFEGAWTKESYDDGSHPLTDPGVKITSDGMTVLTFTFRKADGTHIAYDMPWSSFENGDWVELVDPDVPESTPIAQRDPAGVKVRFGGGSVTTAMTIPPSGSVFETAFLDARDTIQEWLDSLIYFRVIDVVDMEGSLERYDELRLFYKSPRWVQTDSGLPVLYTLQEDPYGEYSWEPFTGVIDVGSDPYVRCFQCIESFSEVADANTEAEAIISALTSFKDNYTDLVNTSFSTDTDEYPDSEEEFDI